jgi:dUTPase
MKNDKVKFSLTQEALEVFQATKQDPKNYTTAYQGESAGLDLYNMGAQATIYGRTKWVAYGEKSVMISTGIKLALPPGKVGLIKERSSITRTGLFCRGGVIDPGFTGELKINLVNLGEQDVVFQRGNKLPVQLIVLSSHQYFQVVSDLEYLELTTDSQRQEASLGSSN